MSNFAGIHRRSNESIGDGTPLGKYRVRLNKLGSMAAKIYQIAFPKEGLPASTFDEPDSAATRLDAAMTVIPFQSDARQKNLIDNVLAIPEPGPRIDAIRIMATSADFGLLDEKIQKPVLDALVGEWLDHGTRGEVDPALTLGGMWDTLHEEHKKTIGKTVVDRPEKVCAVLNAQMRHRQQLARERNHAGRGRDPIDVEEAVPKVEHALDTKIDQLKNMVDETPHKDIASDQAVDEIKQMSLSIGALHEEARREVLGNVRSRSPLGR